MRILYVSHDFLPNHPSGTEIYTAQLAARVRDRGHEVHVFTTEKDIGRPHLRLDRREWDGYAVHELVNNLFYDDFRETWDWPAAAAVFGDLLDELAPDVVHVMHLLYLSVGCVEEAARRGIPVIYTLHDYWLQCARFGQRVHADGSICHTIDFERCGTCLTSLKFAQSPLERRTAQVIAKVRSTTGVDLEGAARGAAALMKGKGTASGDAPAAPDAGHAARMAQAMATRDRELRERLVPRVQLFIAPSRFLRERSVEWGIPEDRVEHVGYGLELDPFRDFERTSSTELRVAFIGTLAPHKAPHLLLEAWRELDPELRRGARLTIHGPKHHNPDYVARLERDAAALGARMPGGLGRDEVPAALREVDLLVVPSTWYENSPLTIHEALATSTPLCVSDLGGMAELVDPGVNGWRFQVGDALDLKRALERVLRDPSLLAGLRFAPVKDMRTSAEEMEERYRALAGS